MLLLEVMRMKKTNKTLTQKQKFYSLIAAVGILALGSFVAVDQWNQSSNKQETQKIELTNSKTTIEKDQQPVLSTTEEAELTSDQLASVPADSHNAKAVGSSAITATEAAEATEALPETTKTQANMSYDGKTKLKWPLSGNVVLPYSMDSTVYFQTLDQYQCNAGMMIQAAEGAEVKSIAAGKIVKVKKDTKYGNMVTVDIGNNYTVTYGQLEDVEWKKGDMVTADTVIGKVKQATEFFTLEGTHLYFEIDKDKKPVDPMKYLE